MNHDPNKKEGERTMRKTKKQRFRASILAFLLIASMVLGMAPGSAGQVYAKESTSQTSSEEEPGFIDKAVGFFKDTGDKIASFFGAGDEAEPAAAFAETSIVDADTKGIGQKSLKTLPRTSDVSGQTSLYITVTSHFRGSEMEKIFRLQSRKSPTSW